MFKISDILQEEQKSDVDIRAFHDVEKARRLAINNVIRELAAKSGYSDGKHTLVIENVKPTGATDFSLEQQKKALLTGRTLRIPIKADFKLLDNTTGKVLDEKKNVVALHVPYLTERGTIIHKGNDYTIANQSRLRPGIYTRRSLRGDYEAHFNAKVGTGTGFRIWYDPESKIFKVRVGLANLPAYDVFKLLDASDDEIKHYLGNELFAYNAKKSNYQKTVDSLYKKLFGKFSDDSLDLKSKEDAVKSALSKIEFDPSVVRKTLGIEGSNKLNKVHLLRAAQKVFNIVKGDEEPDERDSVEFAEIHSIEDFLPERINKDAGHLFRKFIAYARRNRNLNHLQPGYFTPWMDSFVLNSGLTQPSEETNPVTIAEQLYRITKLGEGGIPSEEIVTDEAREVHPSQVGFIDTIAGPECFDKYTEVYTSNGWIKWDKVDETTLFACVIGNKLRFERPLKLVKEMYSGRLLGIKTDELDILVTPTHRHYVRLLSGLSGFDFRYACDIYGSKFLIKVEPNIDKLIKLGYLSDIECMIDSTSHYLAEYSDYVYCAVVPGGRLLIRRGECIPYWSGNSAKIGVDVRSAFKTYKGSDNRLYAKFTDKHGKEQLISVDDLHDKVLGFPGERPDSKGRIHALKNNKVIKVLPSEVDYFIPSYAHMTSPMVNLVPMPTGYMASRQFFSAKYFSQFLPVIEGEPPYVRNQVPGKPEGFDFYTYWGRKLAARTAPVDGTIKRVGKKYITLEGSDGKTYNIELANNFPFNRLTGLTHKPVVKAGTKVKKGDILASSNFTDKTGALSFGRNLKTAIIPARGWNFEDAVVISESAAKKLANERMFGFDVDTRAANKVEIGRDKYVGAFPNQFSNEQLAKLDNNGIAKPGTVLRKGDPIILAVKPKVMTIEDARLGKLHKVLRNVYQDHSEVWEHDYPGIVTDAVRTSSGASVNVKAFAPFKQGDKLTNIHANKGIVSKIIPDDQMPIDPRTGERFEVLFNPLGIPSRVAPNNILFTYLGEIAHRTKKPYVLPMEPPPEGWREFVAKELKRHRIPEKIDIVDPATGKKIKNIAYGYMYFSPFHHLAEKKLSSRETGLYDVDRLPAKGSEGRAKRVGQLDMNALLSHGALENIKDIVLIKGNRNDDFWLALKTGRPLPAPDIPFVYKKFHNLLKASGINIQETAHGNFQLSALTDKDIEKISNGPIQTSDTVDTRTLQEKPGGLFDLQLTGGAGSTNKWAHIDLPEPMPNPVMETPIKKILGLTDSQYQAIIAGKEKLNGLTGGLAIKKALAAINIPEEIKHLKSAVLRLKGQDRDNAIKKLRYLTAVEKTGVKPEDWVLTKVPVIPPAFRPISVMGDTLLISDLNDLYKELIEISDTYKQSKSELPEEDLHDDRLQIYNAVKAIMGWGEPISVEAKARGLKGAAKQIMGKSPKEGLWQKKITSKAVDLVARGVVSPNPNLEMDTIALPEEQLWEIYTPFVIRRLVKRGVKPLRAKEMVEERDSIAKEELLKEMDIRPVIANRAPSWHKFNVMAFKPIIASGDTVEVSPLVVSAFNMDFDGDDQNNLIIFAISKTNIEKIKIYFKNLLDKFDFREYNNPPDIKVFKFFNTLHERRINMSYFNVELAAAKDFEFFICDLSDFPHFNDSGFVCESKNKNAKFYKVPDGIKVAAYDEKEAKLVLSDVSYFSIHEGREVVIVTLKNGIQIYTDDDERALYGINPKTFKFERRRPKDYKDLLIPIAIRTSALYETPSITSLLVPKKYQTSKSNSIYTLRNKIDLTKEVGYFFGVMIGDGWIGYHKDMPKSVSISGVNSDVINAVKDIISRFFLSEMKVNNWVDTQGKKSEGFSEAHHIWSVNFAEWLSSYLPRGAENKQLPYFWASAPRDFRIGLLSGLIDTDGTITITRSKGKNKPQLTISYTTISFRLAREIQQLCKSLGIYASITYSKTTRAGNKAWMVNVSSVDFIKYSDEYIIKKINLEEILDSVSVSDRSGGNSRLDTIPISPELANAYAAVDFDKNYIINSKTGKKQGSSLYVILKRAASQGYISRSIAFELIKKYPEVEIPEVWAKMLKATDISWQSVKKVEFTGKVETGYDLTVPGKETFMSCDGVILSNTSQYHVPITDAAVKEAWEKMTPSANLFSLTDLRSLRHPISKEMLLGIWKLLEEPEGGKPPKRFKTLKEAREAFNKGEIDHNDPIIIEDR